MSDNSQNQPGQTDGAAASADAPAKKKYKAVTINRFGMSAPLPNSRGDVSSRAYWSSYRGNPRFVIQTNDPNDANNNFGKITAAMDLATFQELMTLLEMVADAAPGSDYSKVKIENKSSYQGDQRFETPQTINSTTIGKDEDGRVWISVVEGNRPTPRFFFGPTEYHNVIRRDGQPLTPAEASVHFAKATAKILPNIMAVLAARAALGDEPDEDKDATGGAAAGGGQRQGGWQGQRQGGGWQGNRGGGGGNWGNKGGGGWGNKGGGGGNWQGNRGNWQGNRGGNGGGGQWQGQRQGGGNSEAANTQAVAALSNNDITF